MGPRRPKLPNLTSLAMRGVHLAGTDVRALASHPNLEVLTLEGCTGLTDISALASTPNLRPKLGNPTQEYSGIPRRAHVTIRDARQLVRQSLERQRS